MEVEALDGDGLEGEVISGGAGTLGLTDRIRNDQTGSDGKLSLDSEAFSDDDLEELELEPVTPTVVPTVPVRRTLNIAHLEPVEPPLSLRLESSSSTPLSLDREVSSPSTTYGHSRGHVSRETVTGRSNTARLSEYPLCIVEGRTVQTTTSLYLEGIPRNGGAPAAICDISSQAAGLEALTSIPLFADEKRTFGRVDFTIPLAQYNLGRDTGLNAYLPQGTQVRLMETYIPGEDRINVYVKVDQIEIGVRLPTQYLFTRNRAS